MYRLAIKKLKEWKNKEDHKPMILVGARQVGKTWIMKEFGKNEYAKVAYISTDLWYSIYPYYYGTDKSTFEQDFMIQMEDRIVPIEVKAEGNVYSQSLKAYCEKYHSKKAVRFSTLKYVDQGWMVNIPLYAISTL